MYKAYKAEFTLGLIGSIIGINSLIFAFMFGMIAIADLASMDSGGLIASLVLGMLMSLISMILGFVAVTKLNKNDRSGGALMTVSGGLSFFTLFLIGAGLAGAAGYVYYITVIGLVYFLISAIPATILLVLGGIMALVRKRKILPPQQYNTPPAYPPFPQYAPCPPPFPANAPYPPQYAPPPYGHNIDPTVPPKQ